MNEIVQEYFFLKKDDVDDVRMFYLREGPVALQLLLSHFSLPHAGTREVRIHVQLMVYFLVQYYTYNQYFKSL